jgi:hypothetical protein
VCRHLQPAIPGQRIGIMGCVPCMTGNYPFCRIPPGPA